MTCIDLSHLERIAGNAARNEARLWTIGPADNGCHRLARAGASESTVHQTLIEATDAMHAAIGRATIAAITASGWGLLAAEVEPEIAVDLMHTTAEMALHCRVEQGLWNRHSNLCLRAAAALRTAKTTGAAA